MRTFFVASGTAALMLLSVSAQAADDVKGYKADPAAVEKSRPNLGVNGEAAKLAKIGKKAEPFKG